MSVRASTIKSSCEIDAVFRDGARATSQDVIALVRTTPCGRGPTGRVAYIAGKKLGGAVVRNRSKRVLRAAARRANGPWPGFDVVLVARPGTRSSSPDELDRALRSVLARSGVTS